MGAAIPIIMLIAAAATAATAVYVAVTVVTVIAIIAAIVSVSATVAAIYFYVQGDIKNSMLFAGIGIAAGVGGIYAGYVAQSAQAAALLSEGTATAVATAETMYTSGALYVVSYAQSVYSAFNGFLEAIHFKTLVKVHQLGYLISEDYRQQVDKIYGQIREVSAALGYGADFMQLILRDTRNLVFDVSASIGKPYDLSEITWMNTFGDFMRGFGAKANAYKNNPNLLLWDLDQMVTKPGVDGKAYAMQAFIAGVERSVEGVKLLAEDVVRIRNDVVRFAADLPEVLRSQIMPEVNKVVKQLDDFIKLTYDPLMKVIDASFAVVGAELATRKKETAEITGRIRRPGKYLKEVEYLDIEERLEDERAVSEIASRPIMGELSEFELALSWATKKLVADELARLRVPEAPEILRLEPSGPKLPGPPRPDKTDTPFVGDY